MPDLTNVVEMNKESREIVPAGMIVFHLPATDRAQQFCLKESFFAGTQHNHHEASWTGASRDPGVGYLRERMEPAGFVSTNAAVATTWGMRKPDSPHSLHRQCVTRFSDMLLGDQGRPALSVPADPDTDAYVLVAMEASNSWSSLLQARDIKGCLGSAALVCSVDDGDPTTETLSPRHLHVLEWESRAKWIPRRVVEQKLITKMEPRDLEGGSQGGNPGRAPFADGESAGKAALEPKTYWRTRYWDDRVAIAYQDVPTDWDDNDPMRPIPIDGEPVEHHAGRCPVVWMQNTRNPDSPEGDEDMRGTYQMSDKLDRVVSFGVRSTIANTDPTLVVKDEPRRLRKMSAPAKGHGQRIDVATGGDVKLLETGGTPVEMAWSTADNIRHGILQTASCVIIDPETIGAFKAAEAIRLMFQPMEARCDRLRVPLTEEIRQIAQIWMTMGRTLGVLSEEDEPTQAEEIEGIVLPPRVVETDDDGEKLDEPQIETHNPGRGRWVKIEWGPYHRPTAMQLQQAAQAMAIANGQKPVISQETATKAMVRYLGADSPEAEVERLKQEREAGMEQFSAAMFPGGQDETAIEQTKRDDADAKAEIEAAKQAERAKREKPDQSGETEE